jgi:hypothetical protein
MRLIKSGILALCATTGLYAIAGAPKHTGTELKEATAVLANKEIAGILSSIKKARRLVCEKMTTDDVTIKKGTGNSTDTFEINYGCNDVHGGANVHRIDFSGEVFVVGDVDGVSVNVTSIQIEQAE